MSTLHPFDPVHFDPAQASPEMQQAVEKLEAMRMPLIRRPLTPAEAQEARKAGVAGGVFGASPAGDGRAEVRRIPGPAGEIALRCFAPNTGEPRAVMLHIHGGGWFGGSADMMDIAHEIRADRLRVTIASVDYRLAPEDPYPAAPDDCEAAAAWLAKNAKAELGADLALVGGESAGGHLSAVTLLRLRDRHGFGFAGANLVYGVYDHGGVPSHTRFDGRNLILDGPSIEAATAMFVPDPAMRRDPDVSPLYAELGGLCPAIFTVGTFDPLIDHTLFLYAEWVSAGNRAELRVFPGAPHGFDGFPAPEGRRAREAIDGFLAGCLDARGL